MSGLNRSLHVTGQSPISQVCAPIIHFANLNYDDKYLLNYSHYCTGRSHTDCLLNNICETFNKQLVDARDKPIITAMEFIREYLMKRITNVKKMTEKADGPLTPTATKVLASIKEEATNYNVIWNGGCKYQVNGPWLDQCVVDVREKVCSCRRWELIGIPCKHAVATIWDMANHGADAGIPEALVHPTYWLATWKEMYNFNLEPINGPKMWPKSNCLLKLTPPTHRTQVGRPKKKRRKSVLEVTKQDGKKLTRAGKTVTCDKCNQQGHNKRSCKGQAP